MVFFERETDFLGRNARLKFLSLEQEGTVREREREREKRLWIFEMGVNISVARCAAEAGCKRESRFNGNNCVVFRIGLKEREKCRYFRKRMKIEEHFFHLALCCLSMFYIMSSYRLRGMQCVFMF